MKKLTLFLFLLVMQINFCMEKSNQQIATAQLVKIDDWQDVTKFAGCIVVYKTTNSCFGSKKRNYTINKDSSYMYGYISSNNYQWVEKGIEHGYAMNGLLKLNKFRLYGGLVNSRIKTTKKNDSIIHMGLATEQEINEIRHAINAKKAEFATFWREEPSFSLDSYLQKLLSIKKVYVEHLAFFLSKGQKLEESKNYGPFPIDVARLIAKLRYNLK